MMNIRRNNNVEKVLTHAFDNSYRNASNPYLTYNEEVNMLSQSVKDFCRAKGNIEISDQEVSTYIMKRLNEIKNEYTKYQNS